MSVRASLEALTARARKEAERNRRRAEKLVAQIERAKHRIAESFYEIGTALVSLSEPRHYGALGYRSFTALLADRRFLSKATALSLMAVARSFRRSQALALGHAKAFALTRYVDATPVADVAHLLAEADAPIGGKPLSALSVRDLSRATASLRARRRRTPEERAAQRTAREAQTALRHRGATGLEVTPTRRDGAWWVRIELPLTSVPALLGRRVGTRAR